MRYTNSYLDKLKKYVEEKELTYSIDTMGCALNENDSAKYRGILESIGFKKAQDELKANFILFNTCCVRENAENTLLGRLGFLKNRRLKEKNVYIAVVGCMTQQKHILDKIKNSYGFVDIVLGTSNMNEFPQKVYDVVIDNKKSLDYFDIDNNILEEVPIVYEDRFKASVSIIYGCNNFCTYCIVPYVRGRERSRKPEDILKDISELAEQGYKEIMLLGQNVNSYGKDLEEISFAKLLQQIEKIESIDIIRFISPHPKDFTDELIDTIAKSTKIAKQIHLPLQSGSTKILKEMNRKYTKEEYLSLVEKMKARILGISFSTDIIVGFPGETEEDFEDTLDVVKKVKYDQIYMFIYSKRKGTLAEKMTDTTSNDEKVRRLETLKRLHEEILQESNKNLLGKTLKVLVEGKSKNNEEYYTGRSDSNKAIIFEASDDYIGKIVNIQVQSEHLWFLKGVIV